jgi:uncharacterized protein YgiM (DUF1202 family)
MFKNITSLIWRYCGLDQHRRQFWCLLVALAIASSGVPFVGGVGLFMRSAHSSEATNDGYSSSNDDWKKLKQNKWKAGGATLDDRLICVSATVTRNSRLVWGTDPSYVDKVYEARRRGLTLERCFNINRSVYRQTGTKRPAFEVEAIASTASVGRARVAPEEAQRSVLKAEAHRQAEVEARRLATAREAERTAATEARRLAATKPEKLKVVSTDEPVMAAKNANVRDQPGTDGAKVAYLQKGDEVTVVGRVKGLNWAEVARQGKRLGFVFAPLLVERPAAKSQIASSKPALPKPTKPAPTNKHAVAVILGNRDYGNPVPDVDYAANDADAMKRFVIEQLGYRDGNIIDLRDATQATLTATFGNEFNHQGKLWRLVRAGKSDVVVFYSGHGVPGLRDKKGYLLPVNADPDAVELNGYPLDWLLNNLAKLKARSMTVYLDACFSGESPKGMLIQAVSGLSIEPRMPKASSGMTVITAATGDQVASWDKKAKHGLFTKYLLDALAGAADKGDYGNGDGKVTVGEVKRYLDDEMTYAAQRNYGRVQTATIKGDADTVLAEIH